MIHIDVKFAGYLSSRLDKFTRKKDHLFSFRCPYCGDSKKNPNKTRGFLYKKKNSLLYKCHNCGMGTTLSNFIKYLDPVLHKQYVLENFSKGDWKKSSSTKPAEYKFSAPVFKKSLCDLSDNVIGVYELNDDHPAKKYLIDRKIPKLEELYYTDNFDLFVSDIVDGHDNLLSNDNRIVIPFYNDKKELIALQGRSVGVSNLRYITIKIHENHAKIFGMDKVDREKDIYVFEGPFDSMFMDNSIAVAGSDLVSSIDLFDIDTLNFVFDNECRNKSLVNKMEHLINKGCKICIWPDYIKDKDVNEMFIRNLNVKAIIENNIYEGLRARVRLTEWRKC